MSLTKDTCEKCWLPPEIGKKICRKCTSKPHSRISWIRYHRPSSTCKEFRRLILSSEYYGSVLPEDCIHCSNFLLGIEGWKRIMKDSIIFYPHDKITILFRREIDCRRDALLDYVSNLLTEFIDETQTCRRIFKCSYRCIQWAQKLDSRRIGSATYFISLYSKFTDSDSILSYRGFL